jgi:ATP phosphoribosyltransferase regulatory subunit
MEVAARGALDAVLTALARRRQLERRLGDALVAQGYQEVSVPLLQPVDASGDWNGGYRVLDRDGAVQELRPDLTGPVARLCAVGDSGGPRPRRLYYQATIFRHAAGEGVREIAQAGAERIGGEGDAAGRVQADAELLGVLAACLRAAGAQDFLLALGHSAYLDERVGAADGRVEAARAALRRRDLAGLGAVAGGAAAELGWRGGIGEALAGGVVGEGPAATEWRALLRQLAKAGLEPHVLVEPGLLPPGGYYTGVVFEVLLPGQPWPVGDGGRYDGLLARWGATEPAVGFALDADRLLRALDGGTPGEDARRAWAAVQGGAGRP